MSPRTRDSIPIGATLREARTRMGLDVKEAEERTKIRAKYLRALENEDWETIPGAAYTRGFLRTYGTMLGLDGDRLADQFRRSHEAAEEPAPPAENVLSGRRRPGERPPSRGPLIGALLVALAFALVLVALLGDGGDDEPNRAAGERAGRNAKNDAGRRGNNGGGKKAAGKQSAGNSKPKLRKERIVLTAQTTLGPVCLVGDRKRALLDAQPLPAGRKETFDGYKRYRIDLDGGILRVRIGNESERIETADPVSLEGDSQGIREIDYQGPDCP